MNTNKKTIFLTGICGSGKGSQIPGIADFFGISRENIISVSSLLAKSSIAKEYIEQGKLVPDSIVIDILKKINIAGCLIDGLPRSVEQSMFIREYAKENQVLAIAMNIPTRVAESRMLSRIRCSHCKKTNSENNGFSIGQICPECHKGFFEKRPDDTVEGVRKRIIEFETNTIPAIELIKADPSIVTYELELPPKLSIDETTEFIKTNLQRSYTTPITM